MGWPIHLAFYRADGPLSHSVDNLSSEWAWPIHSTVFRVDGPRRANGSEHIYFMRYRNATGVVGGGGGGMPQSVTLFM